MISEQISQLLHAGHSGGKLYIPIDEIVVGEQVASEAKLLVEKIELGDHPVAVCDDYTEKVLGQQVSESLGVEKLVLQDEVRASDERVREVRKATANYSGIIAVGSGTINDLCKYASYLDNKNYCVFGTALSMNGYASANASIEGDDGLSRSFKAQMPKAIFFDTRVITEAPKRMTASGFADTICRSTVQADWMLSHLLLNTEYNSLPFEWLENFEKDLIKNARWLEKGDKTSTIELANAIILSGIGMFICDGSYPASQGEHLIAHTSEMAHKNILSSPLHGEKIAVTLLTMAKLQEFMLSSKPKLGAREINEAEVLKYFGHDLGHHVLKEFKMKALDGVKLEKATDIINKDWSSIRLQIQAKMTPYRVLKEALELVGAPTTAEDIGWDMNIYKSTVKHAFLTRNRFTFLDLAFYSGKLNEFVDSL